MSGTVRSRSHPGRLVALGVLLAGVAVASAAEKYPTISYRKAKDHVGEVVWVRGKVLRAEQSAEGVYLLFSGNPKYVRVLIPKQYLSNFKGDVRHRYVGQQIKAVGRIEQIGMKLVLGVNEPKRIQVIEKTTD